MKKHQSMVSTGSISANFSLPTTNDWMSGIESYSLSVPTDDFDTFEDAFASDM